MKDVWRRILAVVTREFIAIWADRRTRAILIVPPVMQLLVFSYAATFEVSDVALAVLNQDGGTESRALVAAFTASPAFAPVARLQSEREIAPVIDSAMAKAVLHVGPTFGADLAAGRQAAVQLIVDGRHSNTALVALGYAGEIVGAFSAAQAKPGSLQPPRLVVRAWFNPNLSSRWFIVPALVAILTLVITTVIAALSVARERELGTFEQLLMTPLRPLELLIGKTMPALIIGYIEGLGIAGTAVWVFGIPFRGSVAVLAVALAVFLLSIIGIGLMVSALARTQQQAITGAFAFLMPAVILSGFATPVANMPKAIQALTLINPLRYMLVILRGLFLQDAPWELVAANLWPMAIIGLVTGSAATWLFRRRVA